MTQHRKVNFRIDSRGGTAAMSHEIPNLLQREITVQKVTTKRMTQAVWTLAWCADVESGHAVGDRTGQSTPRDWTNWCTKAQKQLLLIAAGANFLQVPQYGIPDGCDQCKVLPLSCFVAPNGNLIILPVDIIQSKPKNFTGSQTVNGAEQNHGQVPNVGMLIGLHAGHQPHYIFAPRPQWQALVAVDARVRNVLRDGAAQATGGRISEEPSDSVEHGGYRSTRPPLMFVGGDEEGINVLGTHLGKGLPSRFVPDQEVPARTQTYLDGLGRQIALMPHPMGAVVKQPLVPQRFRLGRLQSPHVSEPSRGQSRKVLADLLRLIQRNTTLSGCPPRSSPLNLAHRHTAPLWWINLVCNLQEHTCHVFECSACRTLSCAILKVLLSFHRERTGTMPSLNAWMSVQDFKHDRSSFFLRWDLSLNSIINVVSTGVAGLEQMDLRHRRNITVYSTLWALCVPTHNAHMAGNLGFSCSKAGPMKGRGR